jgi:hypothetical protein
VYNSSMLKSGRLYVPVRQLILSLILWQDFDPFTLSIEGDKLRGRGTTDCLGHVALLTELFRLVTPLDAFFSGHLYDNALVAS